TPDGQLVIGEAPQHLLVIVHGVRVALFVDGQRVAAFESAAPLPSAPGPLAAGPARFFDYAYMSTLECEQQLCSGAGQPFVEAVVRERTTQARRFFYDEVGRKDVISLFAAVARPPREGFAPIERLAELD